MAEKKIKCKCGGMMGEHSKKCRICVKKKTGQNIHPSTWK